MEIIGKHPGSHGNTPAQRRPIPAIVTKQPQIKSDFPPLSFRNIANEKSIVKIPAGITPR